MFIGLFVALVCVLSFYVHRHREGKTGEIDNVIITLVATLQKQVFYISHGTRLIIDRYILLKNMKIENEKLENEISVLRAKLVELEEIRLENDRLKNLLNFKEKIKYKYIPAKIIAYDVSTEHKSLRIDRGKNDGIEIGMGVIASHGVVGRILRTSPHYSDVLTLIDPTSRIDAVVQRSRVKAILVGGGKEELTCSLKYIDKLEDVAIGDIVESSGFNHIFPAGLIIGKITDIVVEDNTIIKKVFLKSAVDIYRLEEVLVVFGRDTEEKIIN